MSLFLTVENSQLKFYKNKKLIDSKSIKDSDCDLWIMKTTLDNGGSHLLSSSVHWDFIQENKNYDYALDIGNTSEIIINIEELVKHKNEFLRYTGNKKNALVFTKKKNRYFFKEIRESKNNN